MVMHPYMHSFPCTFLCDGVWPLYKTVEQVFYKTVTDIIFFDGNWALKFNISYPLKRRSSEPSHRMTHDRLIKRSKIYVTVNLVHMSDRLIRCRIWRCTPSYMTVVDRHIDFKNPTRCDEMHVWPPSGPCNDTPWGDQLHRYIWLANTYRNFILIGQDHPLVS